MNPPDFDSFWDAERKRLAALPLDAKWTPLPDYGTADVDCSQIDLQNVGLTEGASRSTASFACPGQPENIPRCSVCRAPACGRTVGWPNLPGAV